MTHHADTTPPHRPRWRAVLGSPWFHLIAAFVVVGLILSFVAKPYWVPSGSMEQTLRSGDRVLVNRLAYAGASPSPGDIIVFDAGPSWDVEVRADDAPLKAAVRWIGEVSGFGPSGPHTLIKRVVGTPGQKVACCTSDGSLTIDGTPLLEPYVHDDLPFAPGVTDCATTPRSARCFDEVVVPDHAYLVLGDHRAVSSDSAANCRAHPTEAPGAACWRWVYSDEIVGRAVAILWPIGRWNAL